MTHKIMMVFLLVRDVIIASISLTLLLSADVHAQAQSRSWTHDSKWGVSLDPWSRHFVDGYGRARVFHGVNVVYKRAPYIPNIDAYDPQLSMSDEDIMNLQNWGVNVVRLGVMWEAIDVGIRVNGSSIEEAQRWDAIQPLTEGAPVGAVAPDIAAITSQTVYNSSYLD